MTLEEKVKQIVVDSLKVEASQVTPEAHFVNDLSADSLDQAELMMSIEDNFKKYFQGAIPDDETSKLATVGALVEFLKKQGVPENVD